MTTITHGSSITFLVAFCYHICACNAKPYVQNQPKQDTSDNSSVVLPLTWTTELTDNWKPLDLPQPRRSYRWHTVKNRRPQFVGKGLLKSHRQHHTLHFLNKSVRCNDGTPAGYYFRQSTKADAKRWIIFLEGGWYCFNNETCQVREASTIALFSSTTWPLNRLFDAILSANPVINPIYHDYHSVFIPYCSSDLWTGKSPNRNGEFYFQGSSILHAVIDELPFNDYGTVERVVFAGSSAGGIGILMNVDRLRRRLQKRIGYSVLVSGIVDSAWFIHIPAYRQSKCDNVFECPAEEGIYRGMKLWKAQIPKPCRKQHSKEDRWKCYLAPYIYQHIKTPVYIVQSLFDEAQMQMSKVPILVGGTQEKWNYIQKLGKQVAESLRNIRGVFAPSCIDHELLTKNNWIHKAVGTTGLVDALFAWDRYLSRRWEKERLIFWTIRNPRTFTFIRNQYLTNELSKNHQDQSGNVKFSRNSTIIFLSRLVSMLNRRGNMTAKRIIKSSDRFQGDHRATALTIQKQNRRIPLTTSKSASSERQLAFLSSSFSANEDDDEFTSYHLIDSCGLPGGPAGGVHYLCSNHLMPRTIFPQKQGYDPFSFNIIAQCNPTCSFLSNPYRMKLVDLVALYDVDTSLLADAFRTSPEEIRKLDTVQQLKLLFCAQPRSRRDLNEDDDQVK